VDYDENTTPRARVLVTGANGFVGARISEHLATQGHHVLTTDITPCSNGMTGDLRDPGFRRTLLHWASPDVVVHAAALVPLTRDREGFTTTNVTASRDLASDARRAGAKRFVLVGSSAVYGAPTEHPITRDTPTRPIEPYGKSKLAAENATRDGWNQTGLTILRPRTILGNGRRGIIGTLTRWIDDDLVIPLPGGGRHYLQLVDVDDVARMVEHVIVNAVDGTWPVGAPGTGCFADELNDLIKANGSRSIILDVPRPLFKTMAWIADRAGLIPFTRWHYGTLGHDFAFDPSWTPPGFVYLHRNADVLATITLGTSRTGHAGNAASPHTRTWETGTLDRVVSLLTALTRIARIGTRIAGPVLRVGTRLTGATLRLAVGIVTRIVSFAGRRTYRVLRWGVRSARSNRNPGKHSLATRVLLGPLVRHEDPAVHGRALTSLKKHQLAAGTIGSTGMVIAAQIHRLGDRDASTHPVGRVLAPLRAPIGDLAAKLRAAHLSAALAEPTPGTRHRAKHSTGTPVPRGHVERLVIGSGPGAAMLVTAAKERGEHGIVVLEAGERSSIPTERHHSLEHVLADFQNGGAELCVSRPLTQIAQGRVLGGGSEVNSGFYHDLPEHHRHTWCRDLDVTEDEWLDAERAVRHILELSLAPTAMGDSVIARGAVALGYTSMPVERWRSYDREGFHQHGMTRQIWDRHRDVPVLTGRVAESIETHPGGLTVHLTDGSSIRARRVSLCAGPVNTPRILLASDLVARRRLAFNLHPMVRIVAECRSEDAGRRDVDPYQAKSVNGYKYGGAVSTPSLLGAALGEVVDPIRAATLRSFYASFEPGGHGGFLPAPGGAIPYFSYSRQDRRRLRQASETLRELLVAAGVEPLTPVDTAANHPSSVHVFGSIPAGGRLLLPGGSLLAADPRISIYDASLLPGAPGVNPQGPLMVLALVLARRQLHL